MPSSREPRDHFRPVEVIEAETATELNGASDESWMEKTMKRMEAVMPAIPTK